MTVSTINIVVDRIAYATPESPLAIFKTDDKTKLKYLAYFESWFSTA